MARQRRQPAPTTVERRVFFYRVNLGQDNAGRPVPFDAAGALQHVDGLPYSATGRYVAGPDNTWLCAWIDDGRADVRYARTPFEKEPDFNATSVNYDLSALLAHAQEPA
ncbi:MAG: hypothetical protein J5J06_09160 [Phycisphaerae bacterium]|nr:hypothetical protein [Phycisphaerae bacterium]